MSNFYYPLEDKWTIFTKSDCKFCTMVKDLLIENNFVIGKDILIINCDEWIGENDIKIDFLSHMTKIIGYEYKYFPMVFHNGIFIGGFNDTIKYLNNNNLVNKTNNLDKLVISDDF